MVNGLAFLERFFSLQAIQRATSYNPTSTKQTLSNEALNLIAVWSIKHVLRGKKKEKFKLGSRNRTSFTLKSEKKKQQQKNSIQAFTWVDSQGILTAAQVCLVNHYSISNRYLFLFIQAIDTINDLLTYRQSGLTLPLRSSAFTHVLQGNRGRTVLWMYQLWSKP